MTPQPHQTAVPLLSCLPDQIPAALRDAPRWAPWAAVWDEQRGKYDKVPRQPAAPQYGLSTVRPERWATFDAAAQAYQRDPQALAGLGYCMTGPHGLVGIDLDNCLEADGTPAAWAAEIVAQMASYTEVSPSGRGLRIFVLGAIDADWTNPDQGLEVYGGNEPRFLTVTGHRLDDAPADVRPADPAALAALAARYAKERRRAEVIDLNIPDVLDDFLLPALATLPVPDKVERFLSAGEADGDRSGVLHAAGVALYSAGLDDTTVFSLLATNEYALGVALDHRRQDHDRAMLYLWREHCVKARPKASTPASPDEFEVVAPAEVEREPLPPFARDGKGRIEATLNNLALALARPDVCGLRLGWDQFRDEIMFIPRDGGAWVPLGDADTVRLRQDLECGGFKPIGRELMRDAILLAADGGRFDSARDWLDGLQWDGIPRIDRFYVDYFGVADSDYARAVGAYTWTALAGRVLAPGCKADMVPILVGSQGLGKSASVAAMAPDSEFFAEVNLGDRDDDLSRRMRGCLVAEIGELRGLHSRDLESIKSFITRTHENWVPKYKEFATKFPRRMLFIGTTNQDQFLADPTGNRRWLPLDVTAADRDAVTADRDQLWAEGAARWREAGIAFQQAEELAGGQHEKYEMHDAWEDAIAQWLDEPDMLTGDMPRNREFLRTRDIMRNALNLTDSQINRGGEMRVSAIICKLGYARKKLREHGRTFWAFVPTCSYLD